MNKEKTKKFYSTLDAYQAGWLLLKKHSHQLITALSGNR